MTPSWNDAPAWAQYLSMDADGRWFWYEFEPRYSYNFGVWLVPEGRIEIASSPIPGAGGSLQKRYDTSTKPPSV